MDMDEVIIIDDSPPSSQNTAPRKNDDLCFNMNTKFKVFTTKLNPKQTKSIISNTVSSIDVQSYNLSSSKNIIEPNTPLNLTTYNPNGTPNNNVIITKTERITAQSNQSNYISNHYTSYKQYQPYCSNLVNDTKILPDIAPLATILEEEICEETPLAAEANNMSSTKYFTPTFDLLSFAEQADGSVSIDVKDHYEPPQPEFIDINTLMPKNGYIPNEPVSILKNMQLPFQKMSNQPTAQAPPTKCFAPTEETTLEDQDDIIFVKEYKEPSINNSLENVVASNLNNVAVIPVQTSAENLPVKKLLVEKNNNVKKAPQKKCKKGRRPRNRKQAMKDFCNLDDPCDNNEDCDDYNDENYKPKIQLKGKNTNCNKSITANTYRNCRRSQRQLEASGAIYCPPQPLSLRNFREWPVEGMHERPEYDPATGIIHPFDSMIRNIRENYNQEGGTSAPSTPTDTITEKKPTAEEKKSLAELCHEVLHHALAYCETLNRMELDESQESSSVDEEKVTFLQGFSLRKRSEEDLYQKIKQTIMNVLTNVPSQDSDLEKLIMNNFTLYCVSNNVSQADAYKYLRNLDINEVIEWSNKQFGLPQCKETNVPGES